MRGFGGDGGPATSAQFFGPAGIALGTSGNLYIADGGNHRIRKVQAGTGQPSPTPTPTPTPTPLLTPTPSPTPTPGLGFGGSLNLVVAALFVPNVAIGLVNRLAGTLRILEAGAGAFAAGRTIFFTAPAGVRFSQLPTVTISAGNAGPVGATLTASNATLILSSQGTSTVASDIRVSNIQYDVSTAVASGPITLTITGTATTSDITVVNAFAVSSLPRPTPALPPTPTPTPGPSPTPIGTPTPTPIPTPLQAGPTVLAPAEGAILGPTGPTAFAWTAVPGAVGYLFEFTGPNFIFTNPRGTAPDPINGVPPRGSALVVRALSFTTTLSPGLPAGAYQFRVAGLDASERFVGSFSDARTVFIMASAPTPTPGPPPTPTPSPPASPTPTPVPGAPTVLAPAEGAMLSLSGPTAFAWTAIPGAQAYLFEYTGPGLTFTNPLVTALDPINGVPPRGGNVTVSMINFSITINPSARPGSY